MREAMVPVVRSNGDDGRTYDHSIPIALHLDHSDTFEQPQRSYINYQDLRL